MLVQNRYILLEFLYMHVEEYICIHIYIFYHMQIHVGPLQVYKIYTNIRYEPMISSGLNRNRKN